MGAQASKAAVAAVVDYLDSGHFVEAQEFATALVDDFASAGEPAPLNAALRNVGILKIRVSDINRIKREVEEAVKVPWFIDS
jgi:hypothetical protein